MKLKIAVIIPTLYEEKKHHVMQKTLASVIKAAIVADIPGLFFVIAVNGAPQVTVRNAPKMKRSLKDDTEQIFLYSGVNRGFSQAVNDGIMRARTQSPEWYLILNDDAFVSRQFFQKLHAFLTSRNYDAISCKVLTPQGRVESVGLKYYPVGVAFPRRKDIRKNDMHLFSGVCIFLSRRRIEKELANHGYVFNPLLFAYSEDLELSLRILRDGGTIHIANEPLVTHLGSQTAKRGSFFQLYHSYRNWIVVIFLHWSTREIISRLPFLVLGQLYVLGMCFYKRYWLLYPKIWWWIMRNKDVIFWQRRRYGT
jgi:GT2 family glycosyltransferase